MKKLIYIFVLLFAFISCDDTLFNAGDTITKEIKTSYFKEIYVDDIFDITLIQADTCIIKAKGGSNLLPNLDLKVDDEKKLTISDHNGARWSRNYDKIELYITIDTLNYLRLNAPCKVTSQNTLTTLNFTIWSITDFAEYDIMIDCNYFYVVNNSSSGGMMQVQGKANKFGFWARGSFRVNADELIANHVTAKNESMADCSVHARDYLSAEILREGKVFYTGNPETIEYVNQRAREQLVKRD